MFHLCIINLVIGTLYCAKGNFEFGIGRVMKSLEPYQRKLHTDTWFYAKRTFLALAETLAKHMIMLKDATFNEILAFLDAVLARLAARADDVRLRSRPPRRRKTTTSSPMPSARPSATSSVAELLERRSCSVRSVAARGSPRISMSELGSIAIASPQRTRSRNSGRARRRRAVLRGTGVGP